MEKKWCGLPFITERDFKNALTNLFLLNGKKCMVSIMVLQKTPWKIKNDEMLLLEMDVKVHWQ